MSDRNSADLLPRVARGDADAVGLCIERYSALVWSLARKLVRDIGMVEDVVQETFIDIWKSAGRFDPSKASEATFIATIARRRVIDKRRRISRGPEMTEIDEHSRAADGAGLAQVDSSDEARLAREALDTLKPEQRRVILLSVVEGLTHKEIAEVTGVPLGTVKSHIRRGLDKAAQSLGAEREGGRS